MADFDPVSYMMGQKATGGGGGGGSSTLSGLTDVDISNPSDGQTLVYNATSGKWENGESGGMLIVPATGPDSDNCTLQKTWAEIDAAISNGIPCYFHFIENGEGHRDAILSPLTLSVTEDGEYVVTGYLGIGPISFSTDSPNGYPAIGDTGGNT